MAAISITAANVIAADSRQDQRVSSAAFTAGQAMRLDANGAALPAVNDTLSNAAVVGVALNSGGNGQSVRMQTAGPITIGGTVEVGKPYFLGPAGGFIPADDITSGIFPSFLGFGISVTQIDLAPKATVVATVNPVT